MSEVLFLMSSCLCLSHISKSLHIVGTELQCRHQWPFQDPKLEVPTIYKAYFLGLCKGISPQNMVLYGTVPPI